MKKVGFVSLGCPKNLVDSELLMGQLKDAGYEITNTSDDAETVVVNTCGLIESAKEESIEAILDALQLKKDGKADRVVVADVGRPREQALGRSRQVHPAVRGACQAPPVRGHPGAGESSERAEEAGGRWRYLPEWRAD